MNPVPSPSTGFAWRKRLFATLLIVPLAFGTFFGSLAGPPARAQEDGPTPIPEIPLSTSATPEVSSPDSPASPEDTPDRIATGVSQFDTSAHPIVYWVKQPASCSGGLQATSILRVRVTGWETRTVYSDTPSAAEFCPYRILSNVVSDGDSVYWVDMDGLKRLPIGGYPNEVPTLLRTDMKGGGIQELILDGDMLYGLGSKSLFLPSFAMWKMPLADPNGFQVIAAGFEEAEQLRWDGRYLYVIAGQNHDLRRYNLGDGSYFAIDTQVITYATTGHYTFCKILGACTHYEYTYYTTRMYPGYIKSYNAPTGEYEFFYLSSPGSGLEAKILGLAIGDASFVHPSVFFFERQSAPGSSTAMDYLVRKYRGGSTATLYAHSGNISQQPDGLQRSGEFILWQQIVLANPNDYGQIFRLPLNAAALPVVNLRITGYEITQGIQLPNNSVFLVQDRPTFLRLFVKSDGAEVPSVTARLNGYAGGVLLGTIMPAQRLITVPAESNRADLTKQFVFELPLAWTEHNDLTLLPNLNPFHYPLEPDYSDNSPAAAYGPFTFLPRPGLKLVLLRVGFRYNGKVYRAYDGSEILSWLYRAYPTGFTFVQRSTWNDDALGPLIFEYKTNPDCQDLDLTSKGGDDNRNLCASNYLHGMLAMLQRTGAISPDAYVYASVPYLPRGSASPTDPVANGPDLRINGFTFDQAGVYGGHEIGHLLGRLHPKESSAACGHSPDDANYPYLFTWVGDNNHQGTVFDSGLWTPDGVRRTAAYYEAYDVMGYCNLSKQWLSDYTYAGIYEYTRQHPSPAGREKAALAPQAGDWLIVAGRITADGSAASFTLLQRVTGAVSAPAPTPGPYSLRLLDAVGGVLASYAFNPSPADESSGWLNFLETVPYVDGTRRVQMMSGSAKLAEAAVSANPPSVSSVGLPGAAEPLGGTATLSWTAADPDGDLLTYDVLYSRDAGATFTPLASGIKGNRLDIDTSNLGGGEGIFRVIASDGVHTAQADSQPLAVEMKIPQVNIASPSASIQIQYGQPLNLFGYGDDPQDGTITAYDNLTWTGPQGFLGQGTMVSLASVDSGSVFTVTLQAINSQGLGGEKTIQVQVRDDLQDPPPTLAAQPGSLAFQFANGESAPQTAQVQVTNGGGPGSLTWKAEINPAVPWLALDHTSGDVPAALTLIAIPAGLTDNTIYTALLKVTGSDGIVIELPVSVQKGAGWLVDGQPAGAGGSIFLPFVNR